MNPDKPSETELIALIQGALNSSLTPSEGNRLVSILKADAAARKLYRSYMLLDAQLHWNQLRTTDASRSTVRTGKTFVPSLAEQAAQDDAESMAKDSHPGPMLIAGLRSEVERPFYLSPRFLGLAASLLVCCFGTIAGLVVWQSSRVGDVRGPVAMQPPITPAAVLTYADDASWKADAAIHSATNRVLEVRSGLAKLTFSQGAEVTLGGPAEFEIRSANGGYLRRGKFAAHIPSSASGFAIETPTTRIVDLGTDFRVMVDAKETRCSVTSGMTDLYELSQTTAGASRTASSLRRLLGGQAAAVTASVMGASMVRETSFDPTWLAEIAPASSSNWSDAPLVAYQTTNRIAGNQPSFRGAVGLDFEVRVPIRIHSLGVFDHMGDGIDPASSPTVQLWSRTTQGAPQDNSDDVGTLLAAQSFPSGDSGRLKCGHRFKSLPKPLDLAVGSYSVVAYDLFNANPFVAVEGLDHDVDFSVKPEWVGTKNTDDGNHFGWVSSISSTGKKTYEVGGTFARCLRESSFGDTSLLRTFTLNDSISASGSFRFMDAEKMDGIFFVGHYSSSDADDRREFVGIELKEGSQGHVEARARMNRPNGNIFNGAKSSLIGLNPGVIYHFEYTYDPTFEADQNHPGPEGKVTLHIYNDGFEFDYTVAAILESTHRDAGPTFDAFGIGVPARMVSEDIPYKNVRAFIDNVNYTGLRSKMPSSSYDPASPRPETYIRVETGLGAIETTRSRFEECKPGTFPRMFGGKKVAYSAGSFEYSVSKGSSQQ